MTTTLETLERLAEAAALVLADITDQDTGWFYQLQAQVQKAEAIIAEAKDVCPYCYGNKTQGIPFSHGATRPCAYCNGTGKMSATAITKAKEQSQ